MGLIPPRKLVSTKVTKRPDSYSQISQNTRTISSLSGILPKSCTHTYNFAPLLYKNSLQAANARERRRMDRMNEAFIRLVEIQVEKDGKKNQGISIDSTSAPATTGIQLEV